LKRGIKYSVKAFQVSEGKDIADEVNQEKHNYNKERNAYLKQVYFTALANIEVHHSFPESSS
jgi:hypothetical protein